MDDDRKRVYRIAADQDIHLNHGRDPTPRKLIVQRCVAARDSLEAVVEVEHDLIQGQLVGDHHAGVRDVLEVLLPTALLFDQLQDAAHILFVRQNLGDDDGLFNHLDLGGIRPARRIINFTLGAIGQRDLVANAGRGSDEVEVVLALQPLLDNLQMEQPEESTAESKPQRHGTLRLEGEAGVVEPQLFKRIAQHRVLMRVHGIQPGEDHALDVFKARQRLGTGTLDLGDGVAHLGVGDVFDCRDEEPDLSGRKLIQRHWLGRHDAHGVHFELTSVRHDLDLHALAQLAVDDARQYYDAAISIEP